MLCSLICFFKQKTAYEMRISDWSSDVCSSDLGDLLHRDVRSVGALDHAHRGVDEAEASVDGPLGRGAQRPADDAALPVSLELAHHQKWSIRSTTVCAFWPSRPRPPTVMYLGRASCRARVCQ